jgi:hypothetical protein
MKTKRLRVEYFLLMGIAFLFQSIVKNDVVFTSKTISSYFSYEDNKSKVLYSFILEFQQKVEAFGIKKNKDIKKGIPIFTNPFEKLFCDNFFKEINLLEKNKTLVKDYKVNTFLMHLGIEEKMYMSSYLV